VSAVIVGTVEGLGRVTFVSGVGIDIRSDSGQLISIPIPANELPALAPLLFERVRISIEREPSKVAA
jgi:hypothetical protein